MKKRRFLILGAIVGPLVAGLYYLSPSNDLVPSLSAQERPSQKQDGRNQGRGGGGLPSHNARKHHCSKADSHIPKCAGFVGFFHVRLIPGSQKALARQRASRQYKLPHKQTL